MRLFFFAQRPELAVSLNRWGLYGNSKERCRLKRRRYERNGRQKQIKIRTLLENEECGTLKSAAWRNEISVEYKIRMR
jgi:hypothetical protein